MGFKFVTILLVAFVGVCHTLPANYDSEDVELVNPQRTRPVIQTDPFDFPSSFGSSSFGNFGGFGFPDFSRIQDYIDRLRASIASSFSGFGPGIDISKGNTTSETKIVDGNRVTINRTVYDQNGVHVVVKNVEVHRIGDSEEDKTSDTPIVGPTTSATSPKANAEDIETFGDDDNNERMSEYDNVESLEERINEALDQRYRYDIDDVDSVQEIAGNDIDNDVEFHEMPLRPYDLGRDTYVNELAAQLGVQRNPDAEEFDVELLDPNEFNDSGFIRKRNV